MCKKQWYEEKAKLIYQDSNYSTYKYVCEGRGIFTVYKVFDGMEIVFMNFDTPDIFLPDAPHEDIVEISWCRKGRVECEFANNTVIYLQQGDFGINGTNNIPVLYGFPLGIYEAVTLVINKREFSHEAKSIMSYFSISIGKLCKSLNLIKNWYISRDDKRLRHLFEEIYGAKGVEEKDYFAIKSLELLYHVQSLSEFKVCQIQYYSKEQIQKVKKIRNYLLSNLDKKISIEKCVIEEGLGITTFRTVFSHIYGDMPAKYLIKYKMTLATKLLSDQSLSIATIAMDLGYNNPSKFSAVFKKTYGVLPKDYRKKF